MGYLSLWVGTADCCSRPEETLATFPKSLLSTWPTLWQHSLWFVALDGTSGPVSSPDQLLDTSDFKFIPHSLGHFTDYHYQMQTLNII